MRIRTERHTIRPILYKSICWPVKIRVRAEPLLAPRIPPDFPASPFSGRTLWTAPRTAVLALEISSDDRFDWRVLGEQDETEEDAIG
jgi:hypothetical protein